MVDSTLYYPDHSEQLEALRGRVIALRAVATIFGGAAIMFFAFLVQSLTANSGGFPPAAHIPYAFHGFDVIAVTFWVLCLLLLGAIPLQSERNIAFVLAAAFLAICVFLTPYGSSPLLIFPSAMERDINGGRLSRPLERAVQLPNSLTRNYIIAQIALRDPSLKGDLTRAGRALLQQLDHQVYSPASDPSESSRKLDISSEARSVRLRQIHAIDVALNGTPRSAAAIAYAKNPRQGDSVFRNQLVFGTLGFALMALSIATSCFWRAMQRRSDAVASMLDQLSRRYEPRPTS